MVPDKYYNTYVPVKYFLTSYRALSDGKAGILALEDLLVSPKLFLSEWKVLWIGTCTLLRTSIDLFRVDAKSCINQRIREQIQIEWNSVKTEYEDHPIFWDFLRKERDNIIHEYEWKAYEVWLGQDGEARPARISLLELKPTDVRSVLVMRSGRYKDRDSLELLKESANWVETRICSAIQRAGFQPDEHRNLINFQERPSGGKTLLNLLE